MARKLELTWEKSRKRWRKMYRGKVYTFPYGTGKTDRDGYNTALAEWRSLKTKLDATADENKPHRHAYQVAIRLRKKMLDWCALEHSRLESADGEEYYRQEFIQFFGEYSSNINIRSIQGGSPQDSERLAKNVTELCEELAITFDESPIVTSDELYELERREKLDFLSRTRDRLNREIKTLRRLFKKVAPPKLDAPDTLPIHPLEGADYAMFHQWAQNLDSLQRFEQLTAPVDFPDSIEGNVKDFLKHKRAESESGQITAAWYQSLDYRLKHFTEFAGSQPVEELNEQTLSTFRNHLQQRVGESDPKKVMSQHYARNIITSTKSFVRWLYRQHVIEHLPRNLDKLTIRIDAREVETFTRSEIKAIHKASKDHMKLYVLLMLNCGYYQSDISNLKHSEVDWKSGRINRKRSKSSNHENAPTVNYPLWDETFRLLSELRATDGEFVLLDANRKQLVRRELKEGGTVSNADSIKTAYLYLCKQMKIRAKPLMLLRKTSATKLEEHDAFSRFTQYFLGQAPQSLAERRYAKPSADNFDRAVVWLGKQFGFNTNRKRLGAKRKRKA